MTPLSYWNEPDIEGFEEAVKEFKERVPDLARGLVKKIRKAHKDNPRFIAAFEKFLELCKTALNPNIRVEAVDEMLVQHLLTERLFRTIFNNPEFVKRNAIAAEVESVIDALVGQSFEDGATIALPVYIRSDRDTRRRLWRMIQCNVPAVMQK